MEHKFQLESFHRENGTTFSGIPFISGNLQWNEPKSRVSFTSQPEFPEFFGKWKTLLYLNYIRTKNQENAFSTTIIVFYYGLGPK